MEFELTDDQQALVDSAQGLVRTRLGVPTARSDIPGGAPRDYLTVLAGSGFGGISLSEELGGQGGTLLDAVLVIERVAMLNPSAGDACQALNFGAVQQIARAGSDFLKAEFLRPCLEGRMLTAVAMTEPGAGSGLAGLRTKAEVVGDEIVVNGGKIFTTHGADADFFVVWTRLGESFGAMVIEATALGLTVNSQNTFMSGERYGVLSFDDCIVPSDHVLIHEGGLRSLLPLFNIERLGNAARSLALGQAAFELAAGHALTREQFGKRLFEFQGIQWKLAELHVQLESARLLLYRAAVKASAGLPTEIDTAVAKLACNRAGFAAADAAVQVLGGAGFDSQSLAGYYFERTRGWLIAGGTAEQMLNRVARGIGKERGASDLVREGS